MSMVPALDLLPLQRARSLQALLMRTSEGCVVAAVTEPAPLDLRLQLQHLSDQPLQWVHMDSADLEQQLCLLEADTRAMDAVPAAVAAGPTHLTGRAGEAVEALSLAELDSTTNPTVRLVNSTLFDALLAGASDIHLESTAEGLTVRYRIDGMLDAVADIAGRALAEQAISRLKVLAELDTAERRVPQDGSFRVSLQGRQVDLRLSVIPGVHGEDAVIRILDKQAMVQAHGRLSLEALGFDSDSVASLRDLMEAAHGMMLVTGPTGSGKTTTLYAALTERHDGRSKVITIEDPVEYQLAGVLQIPVNEKKGLTFARGLRSILRHDPDTILVGEIRDRETAEIAVQSALTGHLVLTTVHANSVFEVFGRFTHMGLDAYALVSALNGVWAQRLLRLNCPACTEPMRPALRDLKLLGLDAAERDHPGWRKGAGCPACRGSGYRGRQAVAEVLRLDDELRELIVGRAPVRQVKDAARRKGAMPLSVAALALARSGRTTLEEVRRVTLAV